MRILHTSDWHLGQHFMGKTREEEHRVFLSWLLKLIEETSADALVVAGDIRENVLACMADTLNRVKKEVTFKTQFFID